MAVSPLKRGFNALFRLKTVDYDNVEQTKLDRCLNTLDLTALGLFSPLSRPVSVCTDNY